MPNWSLEEVEATVADYLAMLEAELRDEPFNKAEHSRNLRKVLSKRTKSAVELKHQNISAILLELGLPYIDSYKPRPNDQQLLFDVVADGIATARSLIRAVAVVARKAAAPTVDNILHALVGPPKPRAGGRVAYPKRVAEQRVPRPGVNYLALEAGNRSLGEAGERFVERFELARLLSLRQGHLANRVERVSVTRGDGLGYDILSFEKSGADRLIEVKTTAYGQETPFFVSRNELAFSREQHAAFHLYRVFAFRKSPKLYLR